MREAQRSDRYFLSKCFVLDFELINELRTSFKDIKRLNERLPNIVRLILHFIHVWLLFISLKTEFAFLSFLVALEQGIG